MTYPLKFNRKIFTIIEGISN